MILKAVFFFRNFKCTYAMLSVNRCASELYLFAGYYHKKRIAVNHDKFTAVLIITLHLIIQIHQPLHQLLLIKS